MAMTAAGIRVVAVEAATTERGYPRPSVEERPSMPRSTCGTKLSSRGLRHSLEPAIGARRCSEHCSAAVGYTEHSDLEE